MLARIWLRHAVGVQDPNPVEAVFQGIGEIGSQGAADTPVIRVTDDRHPVVSHPVESSVGRNIIDDVDILCLSGLSLNRVKHLRDDIGVIMRVNMG
jgi:hypothetical protein